MRVASLDKTNVEAAREAYWMIMYIFLSKYYGIDISESFQKGGTIRNMLKDVEVRNFRFESGFLHRVNGEPGKDKIDLSSFVPVAKQESQTKLEFSQTNNAHNLTNVMRTKSEMGVFSDYPHIYKLRLEGKKDELLYAMRATENGEFIISSMKDVFCKYGPNYIGTLQPNMLGTQFELLNHGIKADQMKMLPQGFYPVQKVF